MPPDMKTGSRRFEFANKSFPSWSAAGGGSETPKIISPATFPRWPCGNTISPRPFILCQKMVEAVGIETKPRLVLSFVKMRFCLVKIGDYTSIDILSKVGNPNKTEQNLSPIVSKKLAFFEWPAQALRWPQLSNR
jgi:hypothetical protein